MKTIRIALLATVAAAPVLAQDTRELDAHVHGLSTLQLAVEGRIAEVNLLSPGMDIVGFEYEARSDADKDAVEAAVRTMLVPENIVTLPEAAECRLTEVLAHLHAGDHDHEDGEEHDHAEEVGHDDHAEGEEHGHDEHDEGEEHEHEEGAEHSEFHARYVFACEHPEALTTVGLPFFASFGNARKIEAQYVTDAGAGVAGIGPDAPELHLD